MSNELAKRNVWQLEKDKEANLEKQIVVSRLVAPCSGRVVYANSPLRPPGRDDPRIQVNDQVRERDLIMRIADVDAPILVRTRVHESQVDRIRPGQKVRIEVHAFPGESLSGTVVKVASLPDPARGPRNAVPAAKKVFTAMIQIEKANENLRPGMSATIAIPIAERDERSQCTCLRGQALRRQGSCGREETGRRVRVAAGHPWRSRRDGQIRRDQARTRARRTRGPDLADEPGRQPQVRPDGQAGRDEGRPGEVRIYPPPARRDDRIAGRRNEHLQ